MTSAVQRTTATAAEGVTGLLARNETRSTARLANQAAHSTATA